MVRGWQCAWMILCLGCAGDLKDPDRFDFLLKKDAGSKTQVDASKPGTDVAAPKCLTDLFSAKCNSAACHGAGAAQIDLVSPDVASRVIDKPSGDKGMCKGRTLVASDGSASLLLDKVADNVPCGGKMPAVGSLTSAERMCLSDWVMAVGGKE